MTITKTLNGTDLVVAVEGRLDTVTSPDFEVEMTDALKDVTSVTLDFEKLEYISGKVAMKRIVTVSAADEMSVVYKAGYHLKSLKDHTKKSRFTDWKEFISKASPCDKYINAHGRPDDCAAILYSGGTTGKPKGIMLTNLNFNALALQSIDACGCLEKGDRVLSVMPVFNGFGLGVCIHTVLTFGGTAVIMPRFKVNEFDKLLFKYYPNVIAGVPAIYEAMLRSDGFRNKRLDFIKCVISGGDSLAPSTKKKLNAILAENCGKAVEEIEKDTDRNNWMTAQEAADYGLVDKVLFKR